jgi:hypothetical protein
METPVPQPQVNNALKRSYISDKVLFSAVNYAISLMADIEDMSTKGAVITASSKYSVTAEDIYAALGKDFKLADRLLQEKREYRKLHPFIPKTPAAETAPSVHAQNVPF